MSTECKRCAKREECGETFTPRVDFGECGHCDGCVDFVERQDAVRDALKDAISYICNRDHGDCDQCVRDGVFDCPARRWKAAMDDETKGEKQ